MLKAPEPDPTLDPFQDGTAFLRRDGEIAGHVFTSVSRFWSPSRPLRWQWWVWCGVVWSDGTRERAFEDHPPWSYVDEIKRGYFDWATPPGDTRGGVYELEWLPSDQARRVRQQLGIRPEDF